MKRTFVEASGFTAKLKKFGPVGLLRKIQKAILDNPQVGTWLRAQVASENLGWPKTVAGKVEDIGCFI